ncbi:N-acetyl-gamma-glutamyl-phosphate reductase [Staphylococcus simiae]|uniref:N-acetyl-gamma-glutamyl-phosphate reductase n=1 Tax=Staphylococcus simiae CCM 7213 = CCUG 51256 TaxID=911238 RepID=G5JGU5_9STAP|nr:N-acetyl-gamma-glutamyl-phosphate reductase [Staphylococcus simiae]EHJ08596.1 N-acetyl-gamma-glutamyl-phosphate reductase [Staphylococcus simiae CCM 7213 = CCUG 51256]PNZ14539.1 N-acetyl-gamma-glutamyl-phosphate reductase [Staphylococcus simiae]SNV57808.1 N-acetyl-gamma-glutamyl-phosphate reductase [Staphylococcus simiae]
MIKVGIVGGSGYGAIELIRLLQTHPLVKITHIYSHSKVDEPLHHTFPHLQHLIHQFEALTVDDNDCDVIFFATPAHVSKACIPPFLNTGVHIIDLSGAFRLTNRDVYEQFYQEEAAAIEDLARASYRIAEWPNVLSNTSVCHSNNHSEINSDAPLSLGQLIANPGCFPTATLLALHPLINERIIDVSTIIIDAKTGVSGAGRSLSQRVHFSEMNENLSAYAIGQHKHKPEIEQYLSAVANETVSVIFTPHLVPMTRGILSTIYVKLTTPHTATSLHHLMTSYYAQHPFVRIRALGQFPTTKEVLGSNYCDIGIYVDEQSQSAILVSVIDNLVKGASGQAIQNLNLLYDLDITTGLEQSPVYP